MIITNEEVAIKKEIEKVLDNENNTSSDYISLYDLLLLINKKNDEIENIREKYQQFFDNNMCQIFKRLIIDGFDYKNKELLIRANDFNNIKKVRFIKRNNELLVSQTDTSSALDILFSQEKNLSKLYDEYTKHTDFMCQSKYEVKLQDTNLIADVTHYGIKLDYQSPSRKYKTSIELFYPELYYLIIKHRQTKIFKNLYVKIDDCPSWAKRDLHKIRKEQLNTKNKVKRLKLS